MRKIAVSSEGPTMEDMVDNRFGRAAGFVVVDLDTMAMEYLDNGKAQMMNQGAGIAAAELLAGTGVCCVLTGFVGPKAFQALSAAKIAVVQNQEGVSVGQAVDRYKTGQLQPASGPNRRAGR